jgi:hypothetical protein
LPTWKSSYEIVGLMWGNIAKKKILEKGYDRVKSNIDFSPVRKHQRSIPKSKKFEGIKKWVETQININIKKRKK